MLKFINNSTQLGSMHSHNIYKGESDRENKPSSKGKKRRIFVIFGNIIELHKKYKYNVYPCLFNYLWDFKIQVGTMQPVLHFVRCLSFDCRISKKSDVINALSHDMSAGDLWVPTRKPMGKLTGYEYEWHSHSFPMGMVQVRVKLLGAQVFDGC